MTNLTLLSEYTALICSAFLVIKERNKITVLLLILLGSVAVSETINHFDLLPNFEKMNSTIIVFVEFCSYFLLIYWIIQKKSLKYGVAVLGMAYILFWGINLYALQSEPQTYQTNSTIFGTIGLIIGLLFYFYQEIILSSSNTPPKNRFFIWVFSGLFLFLVCDLGIMSLINYMIEHNLRASDMPIVYLKYWGSIIYYLSYIPALIWMKRL